MADHLQRLGHAVSLATRDPHSTCVKNALARNSPLRVAPPKSAVREAEVVFFATPFAANEAALAEVREELEEKILVDCTNPLGPNLTHGLNSERSGLEVVQALVPQAHVVKAFSIYGFEKFEDNSIAGSNVRPVMMYCCNHLRAKQVVGMLIEQLGWEPLDVGGA